MADDRPPRMPQTKPMSVGSAFDAFAKSYIHEALFGRGYDPKFQLQTLFEAQVEPQNRDWAYDAGKYAFNCYKESGALADMMLELNSGIGTPRFELEVHGVVNGSREGVAMDLEGGVTLLGKPDVFYINKVGAHVIVDFKVNGYCSNYKMSPMQGYLKLREKGRNLGHHKACQMMTVNGMLINVAAFLENYNESWARQLAIYGWLCGEDIGSDFICGIDQLVCNPTTPGCPPSIRVAEHRLRISKKFQQKVFEQAMTAWEIINSDHFFRHLSPEESVLRCQALDGVAAAVRGEGTAEDRWFAQACYGIEV